MIYSYFDVFIYYRNNSKHKKKIKENTNLTTLPSLRALNIIKTVEISFANMD